MSDQTAIPTEVRAREAAAAAARPFDKPSPQQALAPVSRAPRRCGDRIARRSEPPTPSFCPPAELSRPSPEHAAPDQTALRFRLHSTAAPESARRAVERTVIPIEVCAEQAAPCAARPFDEHSPQQALAPVCRAPRACADRIARRSEPLTRSLRLPAASSRPSPEHAMLNQTELRFRIHSIAASASAHRAVAPEGDLAPALDSVEQRHRPRVNHPTGPCGDLIGCRADSLTAFSLRAGHTAAAAYRTLHA